MARYWVVVEGSDMGAPQKLGPFDGLAVAKALGQKTALQTSRSVVVRDDVTGEHVARFEGVKSEPAIPTLAQTVSRMRAANDRLKEALIPLSQTQSGRPNKK